jgi:lipopolysaccharide export system permease protein
MAPMGAMIAYACLMLGGFSRFGLWRQIGLAVALLIVAQMTNTAASGAAMRSDQAWPLIYLTPLAGMGLAVGLMAYAQTPRRRPRAQANPPGNPA